MTIQEITNELKIKESYLKSHWTRIKEGYEEKGIILIKVGRGNNADYGIKYPGENEIRWETRING